MLNKRYPRQVSFESMHSFWKYVTKNVNETIKLDYFIISRRYLLIHLFSDRNLDIQGKPSVNNVMVFNL